ncbi:hypothetical protein GCM10010174_81620 [Kutzneria viridogrisea]|uniref:Pyruvate phosphate dikinase AMP/ATP-binding domain-containing protein n=2 Tax=Kutzneria TaxID=43356 RepID=W5WPD6_9PSEU|nr:PEP/pyruvate-binding domain-containing protein [Kutzneria albida]AHI00050.1 hypothetical protein KALB_6691 [Kutzneria albida DSM 43870]MBA8925229.1 hypothetical protein [Kutzneria viridogrisea]
MTAFTQLAGKLGGYPFVKVVVDRPNETIHFLDDASFSFHVEYIATQILGMPRAELEGGLDAFNHSVYQDPDRRFYLGILALHTRDERRIFSLETVEVDTMSAEMLTFFHDFVRANVDPALPMLLKPANHFQEQLLAGIPAARLPRISAHELFSSARFVPLNPGSAHGRLRAFRSEAEYRAAADSLEWYDIIVMHRVPDDIPRLAGIVNAHHTTPLSHTNVLASGWRIPNAIQLGVFDQIEREGLDRKWVRYEVVADGEAVVLEAAEEPVDVSRRPAWYAQRVVLEEPESESTPIASLNRLRLRDRHRYGTKAANLGELHHVLAKGSGRLLGFYQVRRPPRENLLGYLAGLLDVPAHGDLAEAAHRLLTDNVRVPRGIALPFAVQRRFLESSARVQQAIGKLKMALELDVPEVEALCLELQQLIRTTRIPEDLHEAIDSALVSELGGVRTFVVRSSSNAEDLAGFSAAGIYESINHVTTADRIFESIREVWASLVSPRSVRLRQLAGISLDETYMGVIVQEQVDAEFGGVLVTTNPLNRADFRNVYVNVSAKSVTEVVSGDALPLQYLYSTVEGGGRTISLGDAKSDLDTAAKDQMQRLAVVGRLLQAHFSPDYTFDSPVDVEWIADRERITIVQLRPYSA